MKTLLTLVLATATLGCVGPARAQIVTNGDFESQLNAPQGRKNVASVGASYSDLATWRATRGSADYLATNALSNASIVNPQGTPYYGTFWPHSGRGCVALTREPGTTAHDQFISQIVPLTAGHTYRANFYALRRPGGQFAEKMALYVSHNFPSYTAPNLIPTPYAKVVSTAISDHVNWTLVTGTFVAEAGNNYITVGYDRSLAAPDGSLYQAPGLYPGVGADYYAIDDVSLTDLGCIVPTAPLPNYGFSTTSCSVNIPSYNISSCGTSWYASHGTPHIDTAPAPYTTYGNVVHLSHGYQQQSSGIFTTVNLPTANTPYRLTFAAKTSGRRSATDSWAVSASLETQLSPSYSTNTYDAPPTLTNPGEASLVMLPDDDEWYTYSVVLTPTVAGLQQVWLQAAYSGGGFELYLDNVRFEPCQ